MIILKFLAYFIPFAIVSFACFGAIIHVFKKNKVQK